MPMPALRERPDDIPLLAHHCLAKLGVDPDDVLSKPVVALLRAYNWPGNVRELRNVVERLAIFPDGALESLTGSSSRNETGSESAVDPLLDLPFHDARKRWQDLFEREYLQKQLERAGGVVAQAAKTRDFPVLLSTGYSPATASVNLDADPSSVTTFSTVASYSFTNV